MRVAKQESRLQISKSDLSDGRWRCYAHQHPVLWGADIEHSTRLLVIDSHFCTLLVVVSSDLRPSDHGFMHSRVE